MGALPLVSAHLAFRHPLSLGNATKACPSIPVNLCHSRRARLLARNHVAGLVVGHTENLSIFVRSLLLSCLDRCLARSILVAYIFPLASPRPGITIQLLFTPLLHSRVRRLSPQVLRPLRARNCDVGVTWVQRTNYVSPRHGSRGAIPLWHPHTHTVSLTRSLPLSLSGSGNNNPRTPPLVQPCARSHLGDVA